MKVRLGDEGEIVWAILKCEHLLDFFYGCGKFSHTLKECKAITEEVQESMYGDCLKASGLEKSFFWGRGAWRGGCGRGGGTPTGGRGKRNGRGLTSPRESRQKSQVMIPSDQELTGISNPRDSNDHNNSKILVNPSGNQERISNQNIGQDDESSDEMFSPLSIGAHKEHVGILKETKSDAALSYTMSLPVSANDTSVGSAFGFTPNTFRATLSENP